MKSFHSSWSKNHFSTCKQFRMESFANNKFAGVHEKKTALLPSDLAKI